MSTLVVGFDVDLDRIERELGGAASNVYFKSIPITGPNLDLSTLDEVPEELDTIVFVYSEGFTAHSLRYFYSRVKSRFTSQSKHYYCLEPFDQRHMLCEGIHELERDITEVTMDQLKSIVQT